MKIKKPTTKRLHPLPQSLQDFIEEVSTSSEDALPALLKTFSWEGPKIDLAHWFLLLNRFDDILEREVDKYELKKGVQKMPMAQNDILLLQSILIFERTLLDVSTNRSIYASGPLLNDLLHTTNLDILLAVLSIALRIAQRLNTHLTSRNLFPFSQERVLKFSGWYAPEHSTCDIADFISPNFVPNESWQTAKIEFYKTTPGYVGNSVISTNAEDLSTGFERALARVLQDMPLELHLEMMWRARWAVDSSTVEGRQKIVAVRTRAISTYAWLSNSHSLQGRFFSTPQISLPRFVDICHPNRNTPSWLCSIIFNCLGAIAHNREHSHEVLTSLAASVNHGILLLIMRSARNDLVNARTDMDYLQSLFTLILYLSTLQHGGHMLVSAGLIPILLDICNIENEGSLKSVSKAVGLLDSLVYSISSAFNAFMNEKGIEVLVARVQKEIDYDLAINGDKCKEDSKAIIPYSRVLVLKSILKCIQRMMSTTGTSGGLRNLIESPLLASLKTILEDPDRFGGVIFASAINIMTTFLHNEPTSFTIIQESDVPRILLMSISHNIKPSPELLNAIPSAFGAICLNTNGLDMLKRADVIKAYFKIFLERPHVQVLTEKELDFITNLGGTFDELGRHQPSLKDQINEQVILTTMKIVMMCHQPEYESQTKITDVDGKPSFKSGIGHTEERQSIEDHITVWAKFLEGYLANFSNAKEFIKLEGIQNLVNIYSSPAITPHFSNTSAARALLRVWKTLGENGSHTTVIVEALVAKINSIGEKFEPHIAIEDDILLTREILGTDEVTLQHYLHTCNDVIRQLSWCAANVAVLTEFLETPPFGHGRSHQSLIQSFVSAKGHKDLISLLGQIYRGCVRLDIKLTNDLPSAIIEATTPGADLGEISEEDGASDLIDRKSASFRNLSMLRNSISDVLLASMPFFRSLAKSLVPKRSLDSVQKQRSIEVSESIAEVLLQNLVWDRITSLGGKKSLLTYWIFMLNFLSAVTLDERSSHPSMHTFVVWSAYRNGCFLNITGTMRQLWGMLKEDLDGSVKNEEYRERLIDTLKTMLQYVTKVVTAKNVTEAPQTTSLTTRTRDSSNEDYFNAGAFLVYLRALVAPAVLEIWTVEGTVIPLLVAQQIAGTLSILLRAEGEPSRSMFDSLPMRRKYSKADGIELPAENADESDDIDVTLATIPGSFNQHDLSKAASTQVTSSNDILESLNAERTEMRTNLLSKTLEFLRNHKEAVFEISDLLQAGNPKNSEEKYFENIAQKLMSILLYKTGENGVDPKLDWRPSNARLLAILIQDNHIFTTMLPIIRESFDGLIGILTNGFVRNPVWIPSVLAIFEKVTIAGEEWTDSTKSSKENESGPLAFEAKKKILESIKEIIKSTEVEDETSTLSVLRLLAILSRDKNTVKEIMTESTIRILFDLIHHLSAKNIDQSKAMLMVLLRHCIEDTEKLSSIFTFTIKSFLGSTKGRSLEINSFVRSNAAFAIRDPRLFIQTTTSLCKLHRYDPNRGSPQLLLKEENEAAIPMNDKDQTMAQADQSNISPSVRVGSSSLILSSPLTAENTIHFLMNEILNYRNEDSLSAEGYNKHEMTDYSMDIDMISSVSQAKVQSEILDNPERYRTHLYRIFLLQSLTELVGSYMTCKGDFLSFSRRSGTKEITTPSKPRSILLNYLLNDLIPIKVQPQNSSGGVQLNETQLSEILKQNIETEKSSSTSYAAANLVAALCSSSGEAMEMDGEMTSIRKFTLDSMLKTLKDAISSTEPLDTRFSHYTAIANLCQNFTDTKAHMGNNTTTHEQLRRKDFQETSRIMFEKNFVTALTTALSTVDLNHPNARRVVKDLLRPISSLSKAGLNLGEIEPIARSEASGDELARSGDNELDDVREDTPDLYRNSALGMFEGDVNEESEEEYEDEDELYDEMEMDYEDEGPTGSEQSDDEEAPQNGDMEVEVVLDNEINQESGDDESSTEDESVSEDNDEMASHGYDEEFSEEGPVEDGDDNWLSASDAEENLVDDREVLEEIVQTLEASMEPEDIAQDRNLPGEEQDLDEDEEGESDVDNDIEEEDVEEIIEDIIDSDEEAEQSHLPWGQSFSNRMSRDNDFVQVISSSSRPRGNPWGISLGHGHDRSHHEIEDPMSSRRELPQANNYMDASVNPILVPGTSVVPPEPVASLRQARPSRPNLQNNWVQSLEMAMSVPPAGGSGSAISIISNLINQISRQGNIPGHAVRLEVNRGPGRHGQEVLSDQFDRFFHEQHTSPSHKSAKEDFFNKFGNFSSSFTFQRWQDESRLLYGSNYIEQAQKLVEDILSVLIPPALAEQKLRKEEEQRENDENARKSEEELKAREEDQRLAREKKEAERNEREEAQWTEGAPNVAAPIQQPDQSTEMQDIITEGEEVRADGQDRRLERQTVTMRGRTIDITELAIDPDFLMALPDEMREEVFTQHIRELRANPLSTDESSEISPEFLQALPEDIRLELLQQEAVDRRRRERESQRNDSESGPRQVSGPADIDFASFLATLDPGLRQTVLAEQDEASLAHLPPMFAAEADSLRARGNLITPINSRTAMRSGQSLNSASNQSKKTPRRDVAQMVDKAGVASIVRLIFIPRGSPSRSILSDCFLNICQNKTTRAEALNLLLTVLQDGTVDDASANNMLSQLTMRARQITSTPAKPSANFTPKSKKSKDAMSSSTLNHISSASVAQQTLMTLALLVENNEHLPSFFLNEHESYNTTLRKSGNRRGKSKETGQSKASKYPINTLLEMLERHSIVENSGIIDVFAPLLSEVTRPLLILLKDEQPEENHPENDKVTAPQSQQKLQEDDGKSRLDADHMIASATRKESSTGRRRLLSPPSIPESNLRLVVRILTADECSSRAFQRTVASMQHLCAIPNSTAIFANEFSLQAQNFGRHILEDLSQLAQQLTADETEKNESAKFSAASSDQAKLLRLLKAMDYLFDSKRLTRIKDRPEEPKLSEKISLKVLNEKLSFGNLWRKLSECLTIIHEKENKLHVATALLPLIEALMVMCKNLKDSTPRNRYGLTSKTESPPPESMETLFFQFTEDHKKILNQMVRNNPNLMSGSFAELVNNPKVLDFDNKRNYLSRKLHGRGTNREVQQPLPLTVRRDQVFLDSYKSLYFKSADEITNAKFAIRFTGEEGVDAGGVTREWYQVLARQMFDPNYALFTPVVSDSSTFHPNKTSYINSEHLSFFKFIGRIIGKSLFDGRVLDCHFSRAVYKSILGRSVSLKDMETLDLEFYKSLLWILEHNITNALFETFSIDTEEFGDRKTIDLIPNGRNIPVTEENKQEFVRLTTEYRLVKSVEEQLQSFLTGFHDIIPPDLIAVFDEQELELLISGLPDIDVDDWRNNTEYHNYQTSSSQIQWLWRAVRSFDPEEKAKLLQFVTGTSQVPLNGFKDLVGMNGLQKFNIHRYHEGQDRLPVSHTCFNQLDLPEYESYEQLRSFLLIAINEGAEGFGMA